MLVAALGWYLPAGNTIQSQETTFNLIWMMTRHGDTQSAAAKNENRAKNRGAWKVNKVSWELKCGTPEFNKWTVMFQFICGCCDRFSYALAFCYTFLFLTEPWHTVWICESSITVPHCCWCCCIIECRFIIIKLHTDTVHNTCQFGGAPSIIIIIMKRSEIFWTDADVLVDPIPPPSRRILVSREIWYTCHRICYITFLTTTFLLNILMEPTPPIDGPAAERAHNGMELDSENLHPGGEEESVGPTPPADMEKFWSVITATYRWLELAEYSFNSPAPRQVIVE